MADPGLLAVIVELNGSGARYAFDEDALRRDLLGRGFKTFRYRPWSGCWSRCTGRARTGAIRSMCGTWGGWRNGCGRRRGFS